MITRRLQHIWLAPARFGGAGCVAVWVVAGLLTSSCWFGVSRLSFAGPDALFDARSPGEARYTQAVQWFDSSRQAIVLIEAGETDAESKRAERAMRALADSLAEESAVGQIRWGFDLDAVSLKLMRAMPLSDFREQIERMAAVRLFLESETPTALLRAGMSDAMSRPVSGADHPATTDADLEAGASMFTGLMEALERRMRTPADRSVDLWSAMREAAGESRWQYLRSEGGGLLFMSVQLLEGGGGHDSDAGVGASLAALRRHVEAVRARFDGLAMGVTGYEPSRREAEATLRKAALRSAGGALAALVLLTGLAWRSVWRPMVVVLIPALAVTWTLGGIGLSGGRVNLFMLYGVVTAGLLALFGGLLLVGAHARGGGRRRALVTAGPVVVLGGVVLAGVGAWYALRDGGTGLGSSILGLAGVRDAGWAVLGGGFAAVLAVCVVGPTLLLKSKPGKGQRSGTRGEMARGLAAAAARRPGWAWSAVGVLLVVLTVFAWRTPTTFDLSGLMPEQNEASVWQRRAQAEGAEGGPALWCVAEGWEQAVALTDRLRALPEVAQVAGMGRVVPADREEKAALLAAMDQQLGAAARGAAALDGSRVEAVVAPPTESVARDAGREFIEQIRFVKNGLTLIPSEAGSPIQRHLREMQSAADRFLMAVDGLEAEEQSARLAALDEDYRVARRRAGRAMVELLDPAAITPDDFAGLDGLLEPWVAHDARYASGELATNYLLEVYPPSNNEDQTDSASSLAFRNAVLRVDADATGPWERTIMRGRALDRSKVDLVGRFMLVLMVVVGLYGWRWRAALSAGVAMLVSAMALRAGVGWMGQPMIVGGWLIYPVVGVLVVLWAVVLASSSPATPIGRLRRGAGGEALGFVLAAGFIVAAGLRSAVAPGLTAMVVAACLAAALAGLVALLIVPGKTRRRAGGETIERLA